MKFKNPSDKLRGFLAPRLGVRFDCAPGEEIEVPADIAWRAKAHGLVEVIRKEKLKEEKVQPKAEEKTEKKRTVKKKTYKSYKKKKK